MHHKWTAYKFHLGPLVTFLQQQVDLKRGASEQELDAMCISTMHRGLHYSMLCMLRQVIVACRAV